MHLALCAWNWSEQIIVVYSPLENMIAKHESDRKGKMANKDYRSEKEETYRFDIVSDWIHSVDMQWKKKYFQSSAIN